MKLFSILALIFAAGIFSFFAPLVDAKWLYEAVSYQNGNYNIFIRITHYIMAAIIGCIILILAPNKRMFLTSWGYDSFNIYLTHILIVPVARVFFDSLKMNKLLQYIVCAAISAAFCKAVTSGKNLLCHRERKKKQ